MICAQIQMPFFAGSVPRATPATIDIAWRVEMHVGKRARMARRRAPFRRVSGARAYGVAAMAARFARQRGDDWSLARRCWTAYHGGDIEKYAAFWRRGWTVAGKPIATTICSRSLLMEPSSATCFHRRRGD